MKLLDVNVLLAAHREDHADFPIARPWLDEIVAARVQFCVADAVVASFLRIATNRRVFPRPTTLADAFAFIKALRAQPAHIQVTPGPRHLEILEDTCTNAEAIGDFVPDAQLAAIARENACEIVSFDRDFARFPDIAWTLLSELG